ncbi:MAG TPA: PatB family C-S lyase [Rectinemataceae bacterium]|nr:PatB family C-S lyase [Rectinemataceae bacterium]
MKYDFDKIYDRASTDSLKWANRAEYCGSEDAIPLWVADMDFACPPEVAAAVQARAAHPIYGYPIRTDDYYDAVIDWMRRRNHWEVAKEWICYSPGVVPALNFAVQGISNPGDKIIIQPPVYHPFTAAALNNGRQLVENNLILEGGRYVMDYAGLERSIDSRAKAIILCSPHNPVGRVWEKAELERLVDICHRRGIVIISDEIHSDLILGDIPHTPIASLSEKAASVTITLTAPNKTFNIAGLTMGNAIISDRALRDAFQNAVANSGIGVSNVFGNVALVAAYNEGEAWLEEMLDYLRGNFRLVSDFIAEKLPELGIAPLEGSYLGWIDCRKLGLSDAELKDFFTKKARIWLDEGTKFGSGGSGFMRVNLACPRSYLAEALLRMENAIEERRRK